MRQRQREPLDTETRAWLGTYLLSGRHRTERRILRDIRTLTELYYRGDGDPGTCSLVREARRKELEA